METYYASCQLLVPIEQLEFDREHKLGQTMSLDPNTVHEHRRQLELNLPTTLIAPLVWEAQAGGPNIPLTDQHMLKQPSRSARPGSARPPCPPG